MRNAQLPRLVEALQCQGALSRTEAERLIVAWRFDEPEWREWPGEAVAHYGGTSRLLADAWRNRDVVRARRQFKNDRPPHGAYYVDTGHVRGRFCRECDSLFCDNELVHFSPGYLAQHAAKRSLSVYTVET